MPVQKMINILKILFAALAAMFLLLYMSLSQRQANAIMEAGTKNINAMGSLFKHIPLDPIMALIPMIACIAFTVFLFVAGVNEKKKEKAAEQAANEAIDETIDENAEIEETGTETPDEITDQNTEEV